MQSIEDASAEQVSAWQEISRLIYKGGYSAGYEEGYSVGINKYKFKVRFAYKSFEYLIGLLSGCALTYLIMVIL